ncbi:MAG: hypothetical protein RL334_946 [Chloroflexota bacterium]
MLHTPTAVTSGTWRANASVTRPDGLVKLHVARHLQDYRNGAQRLCHAANAGGFLAHETVAQAQVLVCLARVHAAHAQLCGYIGRTAHGGALVRAEHHLERAALGLQHALGKAAHHRQAFGVDVH